MKTEKIIVSPDYISLTTLQITTGFTETDIIFSNATAFIYLFEEKFYLITNWHNVTGHNPLTGEPISDEHAGIPNIFLTNFRTKNSDGKTQQEIIYLYEDAEMTKPKWLIHPKYEENVDVVAIELTTNDKLTYSAINKADFDNNIPPIVGDDCYVIGYPFDKNRLLGLPIWKRGSIATEPSVHEDLLPKILIDTATRPGLSGSPVIFQRTGLHNMTNGIVTRETIIGRIRGFLGIYSGRIGKDEMQAQLGIVWKGNVIEEIIKGQVIGNIEFQKGKKRNGY